LVIAATNNHQGKIEEIFFHITKQANLLLGNSKKKKNEQHAAGMTQKKFSSYKRMRNHA